MSDTYTDNDYLTPTQLGEAYNISPRTIERWGKSKRVRVKPNPLRKRGMLYHRGDVARLAHVAAEQEVPPPTPSTELVPPSELLSMLGASQDNLNRAMREIGRLEGEVGKLQVQLEAQQKLLTAAEEREQRLVTAESELGQLRRDLSRLPWWVRILFLRSGDTLGGMQPRASLGHAVVSRITPRHR